MSQIERTVLFTGYHVHPASIAAMHVLPDNQDQCRTGVQLLGSSSIYRCLDRVGHAGEHAYAIQEEP